MSEMEWSLMNTVPRDRSVLLLFGETIPDCLDVRAGTFTSGDILEELGYREFAKYGGWLIWNSGSDFYAVDFDAPLAWCSVPIFPSAERRSLTPSEPNP